jgi:hypothetical protein
LITTSLAAAICAQELVEQLRVLRRAAVLRVARVQVHDRGAGLRRADRRLGDLGRASPAGTATCSACGSSP